MILYKNLILILLRKLQFPNKLILLLSSTHPLIVVKVSPETTGLISPVRRIGRCNHVTYYRFLIGTWSEIAIHCRASRCVVSVIARTLEQAGAPPPREHDVSTLDTH